MFKPLVVVAIGISLASSFSGLRAEERVPGKEKEAPPAPEPPDSPAPPAPPAPPATPALPPVPPPAPPAPPPTALKSSQLVPPALNFKVRDIDGKEVELSSYLGKALIIVNVASKCGLTQDQYAGLQKLYAAYKDKGLEILAFPANDFRAQEPGKDQEIKAFCSTKGVTFPLFAKITVKGEGIHPLYRFLTEKETNPKFAGAIQWNFQKFLVDRKGEVVGRFDPQVDPMAKEVIEAVEKALKVDAGKVERR